MYSVIEGGAGQTNSPLEDMQMNDAKPAGSSQDVADDGAGGGWPSNLSPEEIEVLAALLVEESERGEQFRQWIRSLVVARVVQDQVLDPESGILTYFAAALDEMAASVDRYLKWARI